MLASFFSLLFIFFFFILYYYNNTIMKYDIVDSKPNFLIIAIASMFGILVIIISYYIFASKDPESRSQLYKDGGSNYNDEIYDNNNSINNSTSPDSSPVSNIVDSRHEILGEKSPIYTPKTDPLEPQVYNISENVYNTQA